MAKEVKATIDTHLVLNGFLWINFFDHNLSGAMKMMIKHGKKKSSSTFTIFGNSGFELII